MRNIQVAAIAVVVIFYSIVACHKPSSVIDETDPPPTNGTDTVPGNPTTPTDTTSTITGTWECDVNGVHYNGTIDTSFISISATTGSHPDTVFNCTGTGANKGSNIQVMFIMNRYFYPNGVIVTGIRGAFSFDTVATHYQRASGSQYPVTYTVDSLVGKKIYTSFAGTTSSTDYYTGSPATITNGKFNCVIGNGNREPRFFSYTAYNYPGYTGYFIYSRITTNTLIMDGLPFGYDSESKFRLMVRTGGTIKPGVYESSKGEVGLYRFAPSIYWDYVTDSSGNVRVTITSVDGNVVKGTFEGVNGANQPILSGKFNCRVRDYQPQTVSDYRWSFGTDETTFLYNLYAGNMQQAAYTQSGSRYLLTVNGESDNGASQFKLVLSAPSPITVGEYHNDYIGGGNSRIDSLYCKTPTKLWNGNTTYLYADGYDNYSTFCRIDSLSDHYVSGRLYGKIWIRMSSSSVTAAYIRQGKFSARID